MLFFMEKQFCLLILMNASFFTLLEKLVWKILGRLGYIFICVRTEVILDVILQETPWDCINELNFSHRHMLLLGRVNANI